MSAEWLPGRVAFTKLTTFNQTVYVSTIQLESDELPLIFETVVFGGVLNRSIESYLTEADALTGHSKWVAKVQTTGK